MDHDARDKEANNLWHVEEAYRYLREGLSAAVVELKAAGQEPSLERLVAMAVGIMRMDEFDEDMAERYDPEGNCRACGGGPNSGQPCECI